MAIVEHVRLIERRLASLRAERDRLNAPRGSTAQLPTWAADALVHAGMTRDEIARFDTEPTVALEDIDAQRERLDDTIEALENELVMRSDHSLESLQGLAEIALGRLRHAIPSDPNDLFFDAGDAQTLRLVERLADGLARLNEPAVRNVG